MTITREFVLAAVEGIHALRLQARGIAEELQAKGDDGVGRILRAREENYHQSADILAGWVRRNATEAGLNAADYDLDN